MTKEKQAAYLDEYKVNVLQLTPEEEALWKPGASNSGYHYFGSAKALGQIGKAFAETILEKEK